MFPDQLHQIHLKENHRNIFFQSKTPATLLLFIDQVNIPRLNFATEQLPRPLPSSSKEPVVETFENTSKPKLYHLRPSPRTDLPLQKVCYSYFSFFSLTLSQKRWPLITAFVALGIVGWAAFLLVATNQEKLSSSVVRQVLRTVKDDKEIK
jgi:cytochrome c oxidase assembly factor 1